MKDLIKKLLRENLVDEDYPTTWNIEEFKKLGSFNKRVQYCNQHLQRISSGSSRIVYKIDDIMVLKLAKNKRGLAQNEIEIMYGNYYDISDIVAKVFESDDNNLWLEMELAKKVTPQIFKDITGFNFEDYCAVMNNHYFRVNSQRKGYTLKVDPELEKQMWEHEFIYDMLSFIGNYDVPVGDLLVLTSYGLVNRNGHNQIVLIDYGLDNSVWQSYYS